MACGENLFRVGKGVAYRAYSAPLPGNVLIVAVTEGERAMAAALAAAGHNVRIVDDPADLAVELRAAHYDVIIAYFRDRAVVEMHTARAEVTSSYLPVSEDKSEASLARTMYSNALTANDGVKAFLKGIHRTLRSAQT